MFVNGTKRLILRKGATRSFLAKAKTKRVETQTVDEQETADQPQQSLYDLFSEQYYRATELKTKDNDALEMIKVISQKTPIDLQRKFDMAMRQKANMLTKEEKESLAEQDRIIAEKLKMAEESRSKIEFFVPPTIKLLESTPSEILCDMGVRSFAGSRDLPRDDSKADGFFNYAKENSLTQKDLNHALYFEALRWRVQQKQKMEKDLTNQERVSVEQNLLFIRSRLLQLASAEMPHACYTFAKDIYIQLRNGELNHLDDSKRQELIDHVYEFFVIAAKKGVSPAFFYLGRIYLEGIYVDQDYETALDMFVKGAALNNAFCFFELSRLYAGEGKEKDPYLQFLYLKRAAEEGYVPAQHMVGLAYHIGDIVERNDYRALAWFRESVRNGNPMSYLFAAEILDLSPEKAQGQKEENKVPNNRIFAFTNFFGAYQHGAFFVRERMEQLAKEIKEKDGIELPEIVYVDIEQESFKKFAQQEKAKMKD